MLRRKIEQPNEKKERVLWPSKKGKKEKKRAAAKKMKTQLPTGLSKETGKGQYWPVVQGP